MSHGEHAPAAPFQRSCGLLPHLMAVSTPSPVGMCPRADFEAHEGGFSCSSTNSAFDTSWGDVTNRGRPAKRWASVLSSTSRLWNSAQLATAGHCESRLSMPRECISNANRQTTNAPQTCVALAQARGVGIAHRWLPWPLGRARRTFPAQRSAADGTKPAGLVNRVCISTHQGCGLVPSLRTG